MTDCYCSYFSSIPNHEDIKERLSSTSERGCHAAPVQTTLPAQIARYGQKEPVLA